MRTYGWPIVLFMGVPFTTTIVRTAYYVALDSGFFSYNSFFLPIVLQSLTTAMLLGVLYLRVRSDERATLRLVWSCTLMLWIVGALGSGSLMLADFSLVSAAVEAMLSIPVGLVVQLWFARQASRLSLAHAFFLVVVVGGLPLYDSSDSLPFYFRWLWGPATNVLAVWLLANFDLRGHAFRRRSVVVVIALTGVGFLPLALAASHWSAVYGFYSRLLLLFPLVHLVYLLLLLPLVYLVRVRQPAAEVPPASLNEQP